MADHWRPPNIGLASIALQVTQLEHWQPTTLVVQFPAQQVPTPTPQDHSSPSAFGASFLQYHSEGQAALQQRASEIELEARLDSEALHGSSAVRVVAASAAAGQPWASFASVPLAAVAAQALNCLESANAPNEQGLLLP